MDKDQASTLVGGGAGMVLLSTVDYSVLPYGQVFKIGVALLLIVAGYFMYRGGGPKPTNV